MADTTPTKRSWALTTVLAVLLALIPSALLTSPATAATFTPAPNTIQLALEGCRNNGGIVLPDGDGRYVCADSTYTPGNLGKGWNELDNVPFRLTTKNSGAAAETFNVLIAADNMRTDTLGFQNISEVYPPFRNSSPGCSVSSGPEGFADGVTGGADTTIYRQLELTVPAGGTCQFDWYSTLGIGASNYPGSSLQAYMFRTADFQQGKQTVPLPVKQVLPQVLNKTMSASRGNDSIWQIAKTSDPESVPSVDTCDVDGDTASVPVAITVSWTKQPASDNGVTIATTVTATNPSSRALLVAVEDNIYEGATATGTPLFTLTGEQTVPARSSRIIIQETKTWDTGNWATAEALNDVATATYKDPITQQPITALTTSAQADATIGGSTDNATAAATDEEFLTGFDEQAMLSSLDPDPAIGAFTDYTSPDVVAGPINWATDGLEGDGSVTFDKTVYVPKGYSGSGTLSDIATITTSGGNSGEAFLDVPISLQAEATLTISKTIPDVLTGAETASFTFDVIDSQDQVVDTATIEFTAGQLTNSADVAGLLPDTYTVVEREAAGWQQQPAQTVDLTGTACAGSASFDNVVAPATASAVKVTDPAGQQEGWAMTLTRTDTDAVDPVTVTTGPQGNAAFGELTEGSYRITEENRSGWIAGEPVGQCEFTVDYPASGGETFTCTFTNTLVVTPTGSLTLSKEFNPQDSGFTGTFDIAYACLNGAEPVRSGTVTLGAGGSETIAGLPYGTTCTVTEPSLPAAPPGWSFNAPAFLPASGVVQVTDGTPAVSVSVINSVGQVSPVVVKRACPVEPQVVAKVKKSGTRVLVKQVKTRASSCQLQKPVVLCKPVGASAAGETAFCDTRVTKRGRIAVTSRGYAKVRVTAIVRSKPKPGFLENWKPSTWRKSWILR